MSSLDPLYQGVLYNTVNASQQEISTLLKQLQTGLKINSAGDDPANIYVSDALNFEALENAATETNAQNGLTYLQIAQKAYGDIITELNKIKDLANNALTGSYNSIQIADFQKQITDSINTIKNIESGTTFNGIQVFNNSNSVALVNEHMFAVTSKQDVTVTTATTVSERGQDYSEYLTNDVDRYNKIDIGGSISLVNDSGTVISFDSIHIASQTEFLAIVSGMTLGIGLDKNYVLDTNINLAAYNTNGKALFQGDFVGTFDGNGHTISNLTINNIEASVEADKTYFVYDSTKDKQGVGLFDTVLGSVTNLNLSNVNISVAGNLYRAGALAGVAADGAIISNVNVISATITGGTDSKGLGGLVGAVDNATVSDSSSNATVTGAWSLGGLVGTLSSGTIKNSFSAGAVNLNKATMQTPGYYYAGSESDRMAGGLVGVVTNSTIDSSYSSATVTSSYNYTGGLAGLIGGSTVTNSYATGNVTSTASAVGGFSGDIRQLSTIKNCYAQNTVSGSWNVGGFYGLNGGSGAGLVVGTISNCFYDSTRYAGGFGPASDSAQWTNDSGLSTVAISTKAAAFGTVTASWDSGNVWNMAGASPTLNQVGTHAPISISSANLVTIETAQEFINALSGTTAGKTFVLLDNIDLSSLGPKTDSLINSTFQGTLLGNGYALTNLQINSSEDNVGIFDSIGAAGRVQDLILSDFTVKGNHWVGSLAGINNGGTIMNVAVIDTNVQAHSEAGGLVGWNGNSGIINSCYATGSVSGDSLSSDMGGLVGNNDSSGTIAKSFANVDVSGSSFIGGLVGIQGATASTTQSYSRGTVKGKEHVGGLIGVNNGTLSNSYSLGDVTAQTDVGGLVGGNNGTVTNSYSLSKVVDSTVDFDVTQFQMTATGETVQGLDQRPNDEYSITYSATNFGGAGTVYAFKSVEDFDKFKTFDTTGSAPSEIGLFYQKAAGNTWNGRQLQAANRYQYTQTQLTDPVVVGVPIDSDGVDYSVVKDITGTLAGKYAFKSEADYNNFQAYSTSPGTATQSVDKFYQLDAPNDRWYLKSLSITQDPVTYSVQVAGLPSVDNMPVSSNGTFNVLWSNAGTNYAFASAEDRDAYVSHNGTIGLFYTENGDGTWHSWNQTASFSPQVIAGVSVGDDPQDINEHYTYLATYVGGTYAFASQEDLDKFNGGAPIGEIAKYYAKATGDGSAAPWTAYEVTKTVTSNTVYIPGEILSNVQSAPIDNSIYSILRPVNIWSGTYTFAFSSETDSYNFNDGVNFRGTVGECYYKANNNATASWQKCSVIPNPTAYNASPPVDLWEYKTAVPKNEDGISYDYIQDYGGTTYAFKNETEYNNYINETAPIDTYFIDTKDGSANPWKEMTTTTTFVPGIVECNEVGSIINIPDITDTDGQLYSYIYQHTEGPGFHSVYAFKSEEDYNKFFARSSSGYGAYQGDDITYYHREYNATWDPTTEWEQHRSYVKDIGSSVDLRNEGFSSEVDLTTAGLPSDDPSYNVIATFGVTTSAFASVSDKNIYDNFVNSGGALYDGFTEYDRQANGTWKKWTWEADPPTVTNTTQITYTANFVNSGESSILTPSDTSYSIFRQGHVFQNYDDYSQVNYTMYDYQGNGMWQKWWHDSSGYSTYSEAMEPFYNIGSAPQNEPDYTTQYDSGDAIYYFATESDKNVFLNYFNNGILGSGNDFDVYVIEAADRALYSGYMVNVPIHRYTFDVNETSTTTTTETPSTNGTWHSASNSIPSTISTPVNEPEYNIIYTATATRDEITAGDVLYFANDMDKEALDYFLTTGLVQNGTSGSNNDFEFYKQVGATKAQQFKFYTGTYGYWYDDVETGVTTSLDRPADITYQYSGPNDWRFASQADMVAFSMLDEFSINFYQMGSNGFSTLINWVRTKDSYDYTRDVFVEWNYLKPDDINYNFSDSYGGTRASGAGLYYFNSESDRQTFEDYVNGSTDAFDLKYYFMSNADISANNRTFSFYELSKNPDPLIISPNGIASSRPDDLNYAGESNGGNPWNLAGSTRGAAYDGYFMFKSQEDSYKFDTFRMGGAIEDGFSYYKYDGTAWDKFVIDANTTTTTNYNLNVPFGGGAHAGSPNTQGFEVVWRDSGNIDFAFETEADRNNFQKYHDPGTYGTLNSQVDITYYQRSGGDTWQQYRLASGNPTYSTGDTGTNIAGRPAKEGYDWVNGSTAFLNAADLSLYNGGSPIGAVDMFYQYNGGTKNWDAYKIAANALTYARTYNQPGSFVMGRPDNEDFSTIYNNAGVFYAFKSLAERDTFLNDLTESVPGANKYASLDRYYRYDTGTNQWQDWKIDETITKQYSIAANTTPLDGQVGLDYRPNVTDGYSYLYTSVGTSGRVTAGGVYAFQSQSDMLNFQKYDLGTVGVTPIENYYKRNDPTTLPEPISGKPVLDWIGQRLEYDNEVGYLVGKNTGTLTNNFYGTGVANANYVGDNGVTMLGDSQILSKTAPMTGWDSTNIWDFTTSKPTLRNAKDEGSEEIKPINLNKLVNETKYVFETYDSYVTNDIRLNTALGSSGSFTFATPASAPLGFDAGGRPRVATLTIAGLAGKYLSNITVADNADLNTRFSEGKDFVLYTNDNGATWKMDLMSSAMYGKTLAISYQGALTTAVNQGTSGFNIYLGDNKNLNVKDMSLDLAGRLNFNLTRLDGSKGTLDALNETLDYMTIKKYQLDGEIKIAQNALTNKTNQKNTMTTATGNIRNVDEAKAKAELAKKQLTQEKTDKIIEKFYNLQLTAMQNLLRISFGGNASSIGNVYQGLTGVNSLYSQNLIDYNYKTMYDWFNSD